MISDKRKYKRIKSDFDVRIKTPDVDLGLNINNRKTINVSATGILFINDKPLEIGSIINVKFIKPNSFDFFEGYAKVVRVEILSENGASEIGVQFIELSATDENKLDYYLSLNDE